MKVKTKVFLMIAAVLIGAFGCGKEEQKSDTSVKESEVKDDKTTASKDAGASTETDKKGSAEQKEQSAGNTQTKIAVYYGNDNADGFVKEEVSIEALTPEAVLEQLCLKNVVPAEVKVLNCNPVENNGNKILELNLSKELTAYVSGMGSTGEKMIVGSICNTYLEAYGCSLLALKTDGQFLETGHKVYSENMGKFE